MQRVGLLAAICCVRLLAGAPSGFIDGPCGIPPPAKPKRIKGGEGVPPLPLPATPLRRTERKREPQPPVLLGKIRWGKRRVLKLPDGRTVPYEDWNLDPNDVHRLLRYARARLGVRYRAEVIDCERFSFDPARIPIVYVNGARPFDPPPQLRLQLKRYLEQGGFFLADACRGSAPFADSVREFLKGLFPERRLRPLAPDDPLFCAYRCVEHVRYSPAVDDRPGGTPYLEGMALGCRTSAVLSPYGLSCSWDSDHVVPGSRIVVGRGAKDLGLNIIAYALGTFDLGRFYARGGLREPIPPKEGEAVTSGGDFRFAQILHGGRPDPDPTAFRSLLDVLAASTNVRARLTRRLVSPEDPALRRYPFLYMTGHEDFHLSGEARENLRQYLRCGGVLFADACCGSLSFDRAFRRELAALFPQRSLRLLPPDHPVFRCFWNLSTPELTAKARSDFPHLQAPYLEGITVDGSLRILYSPLDVGNGWEGVPHPFSRGYEAAYARKLGVNIIVYALTH